MKERNHAFDLLCGLCIIRVIMLHVISVCGYRNEFWFQKTMAWTFFFMGFFFFKAGYFNRSVAGDTVAYCWDKARRLLLPYLVWGLIGSVIYFGFLWIFPDEFANLARTFRWNHLWKMSHFYGNPPCWFLFSFFMGYVAVHFLRKFEGDTLRGKFVKGVGTVITLACPALSWWLWKQGNPLWLSLSNVPMGLFFFQLGHWWHLLEGKLPRLPMLAISVCFIGLFCYLNRHMHGEYDMSLNQWVQRPWGAGINSTLALCGISGLLLTLRVPRVPLLCYIGEHSMTFFVAHYPLLFLYRFLRTLSGGNIYHSVWDNVAMLCIIFTVCLLLVPVVERYPWLSGRWSKTSKQ